MDLENWNIITEPGTSDVEVKRSHFICALKRVKSEEEAREFINSVRREHFDARHNCFAMRIGRPGNVFERSGDDGEPQGTAGKPMLEILKGRGLYDICAVVTRYFGGTLLGTGGLVRAYSDSLKEAVEASGISRVSRGLKVAVKCDYQSADRIKIYALNASIPVISEEYGEACSFTYIVAEGAEDGFLSKITELSLGRAETDILGEVLYYGVDRPVIYE